MLVFFFLMLIFSVCLMLQIAKYARIIVFFCAYARTYVRFFSPFVLGICSFSPVMIDVCLVSYNALQVCDCFSFSVILKKKDMYTYLETYYF